MPRIFFRVFMQTEEGFQLGLCNLVLVCRGPVPAKQPWLANRCVQGVAVDWTFSFRKKFVGLESFLGDTTMVGGAQHFFTFWSSLGGSLGAHWPNP